METVTTLEQRTQAVLAMLRAGDTTGSHVDVFDGEPVAVADDDGAAHPYAALYPAPGFADTSQQVLDTTPGHLTWSFQVTAAGGDVVRGRRAVDRVNTRLLNRRLLVAGVEHGVIRAVVDPGPLRTDRTVTPWRVWVPLLFTVDL